MKKTLRTILVGALCASMLVPLAACEPEHGDKVHKYDTETRAVALAIGAVEENFNPFFYTSLNDGEIISLTQIPLITSDEKAELTCGQNQATVALAYKETVYDKDGNKTDNGDENGSTVYEFVIKNGMKFSDGEDLTIKDVLFNLYVYLDPLYSGSSTIYSTKIKGLSKYRSQDPLASDDAGDEYQLQFMGNVNKRYNDLLNYDDKNPIPLTPQIEEDLRLVADKFREELNSDWTGIEGTAGSYEKEYLFKEDWEVFYFNENFVGYQMENYDIPGIDPSKPVRMRKTTEGYDPDTGKPKGKFLTEIDEGGAMINLRTAMEDALKGLTGEARSKAMKEEAVNTIFEDYLDVEGEGDDRTVSFVTGKLDTLLTQWATAGTVRTAILNDEMSKYFNDKLEGGQLKVSSIEGITTYRTTKSEFGTIKKGSQLEENETYDVLRVEIKGVDPAAKWQFGFTVTPMHYYSGTVDGVDYVKRAKDTDPNDDKVSNRFGVAFNNTAFFDRVLNAPEKTRKPVGAGPYKVKEGNDRIYLNEQAQYERNTHFDTVGSQINNANIKYLNYQKTNDDMLVSTLKTKTSLDYGAPNCTPDNIGELAGSGLQQIQYDTNGFGYVGINPKFVPDIHVRQAIIMAMNVPQIVSSYYTKDYAKVIYRPISTTSWVYTRTTDPADKEEYFSEYYPYVSDNTSQIESLVKQAGFTQKNSDDVLTNPQTGETLKFTFTIAGETEDHPAYDMFTNAARILNSVGFDITVQTNIQALALLAQGKLAVWAAAWSTGIDPDMYQVYHKDSKASSVKNWGYDVILNDTTGKYATEQRIINELSELIEEGRSYVNLDTRTGIYREALNKVMELAVELPTYQRKDLVVYNSDVIDGTTLNKDANANAGVLNRIWELDFN